MIMINSTMYLYLFSALLIMKLERQWLFKMFLLNLCGFFFNIVQKLFYRRVRNIMDSDSQYSIEGERKDLRKKHIQKRQRNRPQFQSRNKKWSKEEHMAYCEFLRANASDFGNSESKRKIYVFINLSKFIKTRDNTQCKTHHQKMMITHKSIAKIVEANFQQQQNLSQQPENKTSAMTSPSEATGHSNPEIQQIVIFQVNHNQKNLQIEQTPSQDEPYWDVLDEECFVDK